MLSQGCWNLDLICYWLWWWLSPALLQKSCPRLPSDPCILFQCLALMWWLGKFNNVITEGWAWMRELLRKRNWSNTPFKSWKIRLLDVTGSLSKWNAREASLMLAPFFLGEDDKRRRTSRGGGRWMLHWPWHISKLFKHLLLPHWRSWVWQGELSVPI